MKNNIRHTHDSVSLDKAIDEARQLYKDGIKFRCSELAVRHGVSLNSLRSRLQKENLPTHSENYNIAVDQKWALENAIEDAKFLTLSFTDFSVRWLSNRHKVDIDALRRALDDEFLPVFEYRTRSDHTMAAIMLVARKVAHIKGRVEEIAHVRGVPSVEIFRRLKLAGICPAKENYAKDDEISEIYKHNIISNIYASEGFCGNSEIKNAWLYKKDITQKCFESIYGVSPRLAKQLWGKRRVRGVSKKAKNK